MLAVFILGGTAAQAEDTSDWNKQKFIDQNMKWAENNPDWNPTETDLAARFKESASTSNDKANEQAFKTALQPHQFGVNSLTLDFYENVVRLHLLRIIGNRNKMRPLIPVTCTHHTTHVVNVFFKNIHLLER